MAEQKTVLQEIYDCPRCTRSATSSDLAGNEYCCPGCGMEVAHVERAPNGAVRRLLSWLLRPGNVLQDRYQLVRLLGRGGFGATYLAHDCKVAERRVAIKEIPAASYDDEEARLLATVNHPAIPAVTDRFEVGDLVYLVLEFGGDKTLYTELRARQGAIPVQEVLQRMRQVCDALVYLHERDPPIIHRDLKPDNILLDDSGRVRLIDFGVAKSSADQQQTRTIARCVSRGFSPPEQEEGLGTGPRSDVYSFGATLYALLTGRIPPSAGQRIRGAALVPPRQMNSSVPEVLDALIVRALELNENNRPQSMRDVMQVLDEIARHPAPADTALTRPVSIQQQATPVRKRLLLGAGAVGVVLLLVLGGRPLLRREPGAKQQEGGDAREASAPETARDLGQREAKAQPAPGTLESAAETQLGEVLQVRSPTPDSQSGKSAAEAFAEARRDKEASEGQAPSFGRATTNGDTRGTSSDSATGAGASGWRSHGYDVKKMQ